MKRQPKTPHPRLPHREWKERFVLFTAAIIIGAIVACACAALFAGSGPALQAWAQGILKDVGLVLAGILVGRTQKIM